MFVDPRLRELVSAALDEDVGRGDVTTLSTVSADRQIRGTIFAKEPIVLSGQAWAEEVFRQVSSDYGAAVYAPKVDDGAQVEKGGVIGELHGSAQAILTGERCALNGLMRLSGIATNTRRHVDAAGAAGPKIVDTRKTTPLWRSLEKAAVRAGGGSNHRFGLDDGVLIKDNHIVAAGSITEAVRRAKAHAHHLLRIEVEVESITQIDEALAAGAQVLLLDNFDDAGLARAVSHARAQDPSVILEASGNMTPERIARINHVAVDIVSVGGLIHQSRWVDLSLRFEG
jgi:nicotinate-nucleotide pyrophosphorylase (carboxylating)